MARPFSRLYKPTATFSERHLRPIQPRLSVSPSCQLIRASSNARARCTHVHYRGRSFCTYIIHLRGTIPLKVVPIFRPMLKELQEALDMAAPLAQEIEAQEQVQEVQLLSSIGRRTVALVEKKQRLQQARSTLECHSRWMPKLCRRCHPRR